MDAVKQLAREAIAAGFYNIDIDTSTLVDLSKPTLDEQQRVELRARRRDRRSTVRELEPEGVTISVGGEIGEVGTREQHGRRAARVHGRLQRRRSRSVAGHGGPVEDQRAVRHVARRRRARRRHASPTCKLDFDTLARLSKVAREEYGLAGAVQHGASTLPDTAFHNFPETETAEIHLATNFQNMLFDNISGRAARTRSTSGCARTRRTSARPSDTDEQFFYKTRKKALGPFKKRFWDLPADVKARLAKAYDEKFSFLFTQLAVVNTREGRRSFREAVGAAQAAAASRSRGCRGRAR